MTKPYTGGCACGAIRYEIAGEPIVMLDCQCRQCQHESGSGHASHVTFQAAEVKLEGKATTWDMAGDGGTTKRRAFCPVCGSPVYMSFPDAPDIFIVKPASLDEPERYRPQMITWAAAAQSWDRVDPALQAFDRMPPLG